MDSNVSAKTPPLFRRFAWTWVVLIVFLSASPAYPLVYVNVQWDEQQQEWVVKPLDLTGSGLLLDANYQNAYGDYLNLPPGPPFIIQSQITVHPTFHPDGHVDKWGTLQVDASGADTTFELIFQPDPSTGDAAGIIVNGPVSFVGTSSSPIYFRGSGYVASSWSSAYDSTTEEWDVRFAHCVFDGFGNGTDNIPLDFKGGHITFDTCTFRGLSNFKALHVDDPYWGQFRRYRFTMRNCTWQDNTFQFLTPIEIRQQLRVTLVDNAFYRNAFEVAPQHPTWPPHPGLVILESNTYLHITGNVAAANSAPAIYLRSAMKLLETPPESSYIRVSDSLPLLAAGINVWDSTSLVIDSGSVVKLLSGTGVHIEGSFTAREATFTSWQDDKHGADTDPETTFPDVEHWGQAGWVSYGLLVTENGDARLEGSAFYYAKGGIRFVGSGRVSRCRFSRLVGGLVFEGTGDRSYVVSGSTLRNIDGTALTFTDGGSQTLTVRDCEIIGNRGGVSITTSTGTPTHVVLEGCNVSGNRYHGLSVYSLAAGGQIDIRRCLFLANGESGVHTDGDRTSTLRVSFINSVAAGNGDPPLSSAYDNGINMNVGAPMVVNSTLAYNLGVGLRFVDDVSPADSVINTIMTGNHQEALLKGEPGMIGFTHNALYENGTTRELYFRTPSGSLTTLEEIQALGGDYAMNWRLPPGFSAPVLGTITAVVYDSVNNRSLVTTSIPRPDTAIVPPALLFPDTGQAVVRRLYIDAIAGDTLVIPGDARGILHVDSTFAIRGYHLQARSLLIDLAAATDRAGAFDIDGEPRVADGDFDDTALPDIGADEYQPDSSDLPMRVLRPTEGQLCVVGDTVTIEWQAPAAAAVNLFYTVDYDSAAGNAAWTAIVSDLPADSTRFPWAVPPDMSPRCRIRVVDADDTTRWGISEPFRIKGYVLTRLGGDSSYVPYLLRYDNWSFTNDSGTMWPENWYRRFDYDTATDPVTGQPYPEFFTEYAAIAAQASDFPSWPTFVRAFGVDQCYRQRDERFYYLPSAVLRWAAIKGRWGGSCAGFALSGLQAFDDSAAFATTFPEIGVFDTLYSLAMNGARRQLINLMWTRILTPGHQRYLADHVTTTPRETVRELGTAFLEDAAVHAYLYLADSSSDGGAHAVVPYLMTSDPSRPGTVWVYVYDPNRPDDGQSIVEVDTVNNTWRYPPMNWSNSHWLVLMEPALNYLGPVTLPISSGGRPAVGTQSSAGDSLAIIVPGGNPCITIVGSNGDSTGWCSEGLFNSARDVIPLYLPRGVGHGPDAYLVPSGAWSVMLQPPAGEEAAVSLWTENLAFGAGLQRTGDAAPARVSFDGGVRYSHIDSIPRNVYLYIMTLDSARERLFAVQDWEASSGDTTVLRPGGDTALHVTATSADGPYILKIWQASDTGYSFFSGRVPAQGRMRQTILPDWGDSTLATVRVLVDRDDNGTIDDTLFIPNEIPTGVETPWPPGSLPQEYALYQNYPNPFNASTVIAFDLPYNSHVTITVYNVLGQQVTTLVDGRLPAGNHRVTWNGTSSSGTSVASGIYYYRLRADGFTATRKMILVK